MAVQKLLDREVSVPEAVVRVLEQAGIEYVFGMPGGGTGRIFGALYDRPRTPSAPCSSARRAWAPSWRTSTAG